MIIRFIIAVICTCIVCSCAAATGKSGMLMESDEVEFQKMKPGVKNPEKLVIKDLKVLSRLIGIICNTHFSGECECKHDMNIIFRKRSREIARYSFCGHCIVLPHSERPLGDLGSSEYSLDLVNELYYSGQNKSE